MGKIVIIIAGPTAAGKTALALQIASHFNTSIISADSRQCFREMNIGVAKPSATDLNRIPHYFINSHSIHDEVNAALFEKYALDAVNEIFSSNDIAVMVGGTGLYIKAFTEGMDDIPEVPDEIRNRVRDNYLVNGIQWLQTEIQKQDPEFYKNGEIHNPQRLMRALEVKIFTGKSMKSFHRQKPEERPFNVRKIAVGLEKSQLHLNIGNRAEKMIKEGLVEEVRALLPYRHLNALRTVGYSEIFQYLDGGISLSEAIELIKNNSRAYAKRQITWFKKDKEFEWYKPTQAEKIIKNVKCKIKNAKFGRG